jgi:hypothetical protein
MLSANADERDAQGKLSTQDQTHHLVTTGLNASTDQILATIRNSIHAKARNDTDIMRNCNAAFARFDRVSRPAQRFPSVCTLRTVI